jgi:hypothetical protein
VCLSRYSIFLHSSLSYFFLSTSSLIYFCFNQVAQAEKRVSEARLQKALSASDERLRGQIFALVSELERKEGVDSHHDAHHHHED